MSNMFNFDLPRYIESALEIPISNKKQFGLTRKVRSTLRKMTYVHIIHILCHKRKVNHGLFNRWTDILFLPRPAWGEAFNPNNTTQTQYLQNFKKY